MIKAIIEKIRGNIARDVLKGISCEEAARFQFVQLCRVDVPGDIATEIIKMALEVRS